MLFENFHNPVAIFTESTHNHHLFVVAFVVEMNVGVVQFVIFEEFSQVPAFFADESTDLLARVAAPLRPFCVSLRPVQTMGVILGIVHKVMFLVVRVFQFLADVDGKTGDDPRVGVFEVPVCADSHGNTDSEEIVDVTKRSIYGTGDIEVETSPTILSKNLDVFETNGDDHTLLIDEFFVGVSLCESTAPLDV